MISKRVMHLIDKECIMGVCVGALKQADWKNKLKSIR
jgi:hypothetical protein